jgi:arylsulfatase A-like enzyme
MQIGKTFLLALYCIQVRRISGFPMRLFCVGALLLLVNGCAQTHTETHTRPPNVLIVIADQWRAQAFGYAGDANARTPNIDRLAGESVSFFNAVSTVPVCSPTRASLLTGQRALTHGVFLNDAPLSPDAVTIAKVLKQAGYDTACIGKWHVDGHGRSEFIPAERRQGFDYWKVLECTHDYNNSFYYADGTEKLKWEGYDAIVQTDDAQNYIRDHAHSPKPFFLLLSWGPPHNPYQTAPARYRGFFSPDKMQLRANVPHSDRAATAKDLAGYYAHGNALDDCVGSLLATLKETALADNTLILFTSDHGDLLGAHGQERKQQPYDESIRVPMLIHWPAGLGPQAKRLAAPISSPDIMPTLLALCGVPIPKTVEGLDFSKYILGGSDPCDGAALISCVVPFGEWNRRKGGREYRGIRTVRYTYVRDLRGPWLLFDNQADPLQMTNLVGQPRDARLQDRLDHILQKKLADTSDKFLAGDFYVKKWGYKVDANGTIPYTP